MTERAPKSRFIVRPGDADRWIGAPERPAPRRPGGAESYSARLTIDVTPTMRRKLKQAALERGRTVADMLRALFAREFPDAPDSGDQP